jgi:putative MATE family efflux protein
LMFPGAALGSAFRAAGVVRTPTMVQTATVLLNAILAPVLIAGWGTGVPLGVTGAGLASTIASLVGTVALAAIFPLEQSKMRWHGDLLGPRLRDWWRLLKVGLPSAVEYFLLFIVAAVVYWAIRRFGPEAQAGFGIGGRILQSVMLPAMAVGFAAGPIVGQNLGAGNFARIRETFKTAATIAAVIMVALALLMHVSPSTLTRPFSPDESVLANANLYLQIISWNLIAVGLTTTCSGVFQGLGRTMASLGASASRLFTFVAPALWLAGQPWATVEQFWWLSVVSSLVQAALSLTLLMRVLPHAPLGAPQPA